MRKNKGKSVISIILMLFILLLVGFLLYEVFYADIFHIVNKEAATLNKNHQENRVETVQGESLNTVSENVETVEPILNNNYGSNENLISDKYYYHQLDKYAKIIYDGFEENKENMKSGTYEIDFGTAFNDLLNSSGGEEKINIAFQSAWNAYTYDNMDVFYIDVEKLTLTTRTTTIGSISTHRVELSNGDNASYLKDNFNSQMKIDGKLNLLEAMQEEIARQLDGYSDYEKIKEVHNWMIENIEYDVDLEADEPYSISGALTEGKAVCEGYARGFKYIMDELNIPCILVSGTGTNSAGETESHAWNYVQLDGNWYAVDVTWDDPIVIGNGYLSEETKYTHFLKGSNTFFSSHEEDGYLSPNSMKFTFPELSVVDY